MALSTNQEKKDVGDTRYVPTVLSFCSGYGGIERGLNIAGVEHRVLAYVEIEAFAIANLVSKMEDGTLDPAPIYTDLKTFPAGLFRDAVDLCTGGYPCQPFSAAGKRRGAEDPRHLWPYIGEAIRIIRPGRVFFENVEGHISLGLNEVISDLEERGYDATWGIFSATEVGAPHQRKRVYIMANTGSARAWGSRRVSGLRGRESTQDRTEAILSCDRKGHTVWAKTAGSDRGGEQSENVADSSLPDGHDRKAHSQRTNPNSLRPQSQAQHECGSEQRGAELRNEQVSEFGQVCAEMADSISQGLQRHNEHEGDNAPRQAHSVPHGHTTPQGADGRRGATWAPEPNVGRVVNGGSNRVDRLRLLGNGVVPQTAAKAWETLEEELADGTVH